MMIPHSSCSFLCIMLFTLVRLFVQQAGGGNGRMRRLSGKAVVFSVLYSFACADFYCLISALSLFFFFN